MSTVDPTDMEIVAWVGPDEVDGSRGIKSGIARVGLVPLAAKGEHLDRMEGMRRQMQMLANHYGNRIQLVRFRYAEVIETLEPGHAPD